jgi:hypothetical protein
MGGNDEKGPNDVSKCHLGPRYVLFSLDFFFVFLFFIDVFLAIDYHLHQDLGLNNGENRPKRYQTCRLGPRCFFFFFLRVFIYTN